MEGRIVQVGTPREIFATPQTVEVAGFIGTPPMNLLRGTLQGGAVTVAGSRLPVAGAPASAPAAVIAGSAAREVTLGVRPGDLRIASIGLPARVERVEDLGDSSIVSFVAVGDQLLKAKSDRMPTVTEGEHVYLGFDPQAAHLFDTQSGARLGAGAAPSTKERPR
jgi:multiple sugar transport system ATP-binding protein